MANKYVRKTGSDTQSGANPANAWLTVTKAGQNAVGGDTVYIGAGVYRETVQIDTFPVSTVTFVGDVDGAETGDVGEVRITGYTSNDKTTGEITDPIIDLVNKSYTVWKNIVFQTYSTPIISSGFTSGAILQDTQFIDCTFINLSGTSRTIKLETTTQNVAPNWLFDRCRFIHNGGSSECIYLDVPTPSSGNVNTNIIIRNCLFLCSGSGRCVYFNPSFGGGSGGGVEVGGVKMHNCTIFGGSIGFSTSFNASNSAFPCLCYNNFISTYTYSFEASNSGQITEDYNMIYSPSSVNVSGGSNSRGIAYAPLVHIGQELQQGKLLRPAFMPTEDSPLLGHGNNTTWTSSVDILNRIRPSGGGASWASSGKAVGAYERHDLGFKEVSVFDAATGSIKWRGPGDQRLFIPVNAAATSISIKTRYGSDYGGNTKPTLRLEANPEIGVTTQAFATTGAANVFNQINLNSFTPTAKGWVILTMESYAAGTGLIYWDTLSVM